MTVDMHVRRSKILILNGSRSTDVNTKYQQQQTNNLNSLAFFGCLLIFALFYNSLLFLKFEKGWGVATPITPPPPLDPPMK